jgi:hypothetical protein
MIVKATALDFGTPSPGILVTPDPFPMKDVAVTTPELFITILLLPELSKIVFPEGSVAPLVNSTGPSSFKFTSLLTLKVDIYFPQTMVKVLPAPTVTVAPIETGPNIP